jgi:hypothetical protein
MRVRIIDVINNPLTKDSQTINKEQNYLIGAAVSVTSNIGFQKTHLLIIPGFMFLIPREYSYSLASFLHEPTP